MSYNKARLKSILFVVFLTAIALSGTNPMIMGHGTDGGGGSGRVYATRTSTDLDVEYTGSVSTSGNFQFKTTGSCVDAQAKLNWYHDFSTAIVRYVSIRVQYTLNVKGGEVGWRGSQYFRMRVCLIQDHGSHTEAHASGWMFQYSGGGTWTTSTTYTLCIYRQIPPGNFYLNVYLGAGSMDHYHWSPSGSSYPASISCQVYLLLS